MATILDANRNHHDNSNLRFGTFDVEVYGSVQVYRRERYSTFTVHMPRDRAVAFAELLNSFRDAIRTPPLKDAPRPG